MNFHERIDNYRTELLRLQQDSQSQYDKTVLSLSGGALGLTVTFMKYMAGPGVIESFTLLVSAWTSWTASVTCVLVSYATSSAALQKAIDQTENQRIYVEPAGGFWNWATRILNAASGVFFILGAVLTILFMYHNNNWERVP